jgi:acyl-CoA synthetase (AMP-forming)/AMP-acid ligase II
MQKTVVAAALGECVHVAGVMNFLRLAEAAGWRTVFLGPAVSIEEVLKSAREEKADLVGVSYRLTPETGERLLGEFAEAADDLRAAGMRFAFGGTPPAARPVCWVSLSVFLIAAKRLKMCWHTSKATSPHSFLSRITRKLPSSGSIGNHPILSCGITSGSLPCKIASTEWLKSLRPGCWMSFHWALTRTPRRTSSILSGRIYAAKGRGECLSVRGRGEEPPGKLPAHAYIF